MVKMVDSLFRFPWSQKISQVHANPIAISLTSLEIWAVHQNHTKLAAVADIARNEFKRDLYSTLTPVYKIRGQWPTKSLD